MNLNSPELGLILSLIHTNHWATFSTVPAIPLEIRRKTLVHLHQERSRAVDVTCAPQL